MAKYYGEIGYGGTTEITPGVWDDLIVERFYYGDVERVSAANQKRDEVLDNLTIRNQFRIVADAYAYEHFFSMKYIKWAGVYWSISTIEVSAPRLILTVGGVYNGPKA